MNDYKELIEELREEKLYPIYTILEGKASDVIEQLVQEYNELDKVHDEMFLELCKVKKEKDAAIKDLNFLKAHPHGACVICKHNAFSSTKDGSRCMVCDYGGDFIEFEWRGVTDE